MPRILLLRNPSRALTPVKMDRERWIVLEPGFFSHFFSPLLPIFADLRRTRVVGNGQIIDRDSIFCERFFGSNYPPLSLVDTSSTRSGRLCNIRENEGGMFSFAESFIIKCMADGLKECVKFLGEYILEGSSHR